MTSTPDVACAETSGEWLVAWQEMSVMAGWDVRGATLDEEREVVGQADTLSAAAGAQEGVALAVDSRRGRYLAVWQDGRSGGPAPDIYAQLARGYTLVVDYAYDGYRLVEADSSDGAYYAFRYDRVGNRLAYTATTAPVTYTTYTYDAADRLSSLTRAGVTVDYRWSERGELLSDGVQTYRWDAAGRLVGVAGPGGLEVAYIYDGANNRVGMVVDGAATAYVVDPFSPVDAVPQVLEEAGGQEARYLYGLDLFAQQEGGATTYLGYDALSVRLHLYSDGTIAEQYRYAPFGEVVGEERPAGYGFTGERWDEAVGLLYLRARYYAPGVGRFVSRDLWPGEVIQPSTLHRYVYVDGNPVNLRDPSGQRVPDGTSDAAYYRYEPSVVEWILQKMRQDASSALVTEIRVLNTFGNPLASVALAKCLWAPPIPTVKIALCCQAAPLAVPKTGAYTQWASMVAPDMPWDYKKFILQHWGPSIWMFDGWYSYDVPTNIHFGYVGTAAGFIPVELKFGAGMAQVFAHYFKSKGTPLGSWQSFWDEPEDQAAIEVGIELYSRFRLSANPGNLREVFQKYARRLKKGVSR